MHSDVPQVALILHKRDAIQRNYFHTPSKSSPNSVKILKIKNKEKLVKAIFDGKVTPSHAGDFSSQSHCDESNPATRGLAMTIG